MDWGLEIRKLLAVSHRLLGWQLYCHPRGDSATVAPTERPLAVSHRPLGC